MLKSEQELKVYGLKIRESDDPTRCPIDFTIEDGKDNVAWAYGDARLTAVECDHVVEPIFGDEDERGECPLCGALCDWHYELDNDGNKVRIPHNWYIPEKPEGLIGQYIQETADKKGKVKTWK